MTLPRRVAQVLSTVRLASLAGGDEEIAVGKEQTRAKVAAAVVARQGDVNFLHTFQAGVDEPAARDRGRCIVAVGARARVGEIDQAVIDEARVQRYVEQTALAVVPHLRHAGNRLGCEPPTIDDAESAGALRHQHPPVGQEGEAPRVLQSFDHGDQMEAVFGALVGVEPLSRR